MGDTIFGIDKGIVKTIGMLILLLGGITTLFLTQYVSTVILGSVHQTSAAGTLPITADALTHLGTAEDDAFTMLGYINTGAKTAGALITVVAIIMIFAAVINMKGGKGKKKEMDY